MKFLVTALVIFVSAVIALPSEYVGYEAAFEKRCSICPAPNGNFCCVMLKDCGTPGCNE